MTPRRLGPFFLALFAACSGAAQVPDSGVPDAGTPFTCDGYCAVMMASCTGALQQYGELERCQNACKTFPDGGAGDTAGNSFGCRFNHALAAAADAGAECEAAGPGGDGVCGANCDGFCQLAMTYCTGSQQVFTSTQNCEAVCASFGMSAAYSVTDTSLQTRTQVGCLLYHSQEATTDPMNHCLADLVPEGAGRTLTCNKP